MRVQGRSPDFAWWLATYLDTVEGNANGKLGINEVDKLIDYDTGWSWPAVYDANHNLRKSIGIRLWEHFGITEGHTVNEIQWKTFVEAFADEDRPAFTRRRLQPFMRAYSMAQDMLRRLLQHEIQDAKTRLGAELAGLLSQAAAKGNLEEAELAQCRQDIAILAKHDWRFGDDAVRRLARILFTLRS